MNAEKAKSNKKKLLIYGFYSKLISNEKHYTVLQMKNRKMAAYWLLVIFAAIGLLFSNQEGNLPFDKLLSTIVACLIGIGGNIIIWYQDLIINERLLNLNHLEGLRLEKLYSWLPQIHHQFIENSHKAMVKQKIVFYVGSNAILFFIMGISFCLFFIEKHCFLLIFIFFIFVIIFLFLSKLMFVKSYKNELTVLREITYD